MYGIKVLTVQADVNAGADNEAVVNNVVKQTLDTFGSIDVLINNAQASASGVTLFDHTTEQFDLAVYSGLYAAFYYMKACYPYLKESKERLLTLHQAQDCSETSASVHTQQPRKESEVFPEWQLRSGQRMVLVFS